MSDEIIDLEEMVQTWAWTSFEKTKSKSSSMKLQDAYLEILWDRVKFVPQKPKYTPTTRGEMPQSHVIFKSVFRNDSETPQTHSLKTERQTTATCTSSLTKGCTKGFNVGLTLSAPGEVAEASVGFEKGWSIENAKENSDNKTLTWATEGNLTVPPRSLLNAELQIKEKQCSYTFTSSVILQGKITVNIHNKKENNNLVMTVMGDIKEVLLGDKALKGIRKEGNCAVIDMAGKCDFKFGIEQQIRCYSG
ncbi:Hypothetical predicted protein [Mytilus galloprovincialis]|nr:Hypothetical predicted protein [Mytilus galloprovincialis]